MQHIHEANMLILTINILFKVFKNLLFSVTTMALSGGGGGGLKLLTRLLIKVYILDRVEAMNWECLT